MPKSSQDSRVSIGRLLIFHRILLGIVALFFLIIVMGLGASLYSAGLLPYSLQLIVGKFILVTTPRRGNQLYGCQSESFTTVISSIRNIPHGGTHNEAMAQYVEDLTKPFIFWRTTLSNGVPVYLSYPIDGNWAGEISQRDMSTLESNFIAPLRDQLQKKGFIFSKDFDVPAFVSTDGNKIRRLGFSKEFLVGDVHKQIRYVLELSRSTSSQGIVDINLACSGNEFVALNASQKEYADVTFDTAYTWFLSVARNLPPDSIVSLQYPNNVYGGKSVENSSELEHVVLPFHITLPGGDIDQGYDEFWLKDNSGFHRISQDKNLPDCRAVDASRGTSTHCLNSVSGTVESR